MQFSGKELAAVIKMAFSMASADGKFADAEKEIITFGMAEFGLDKEEILACVTVAQKMETAEAISVLSSMDEEQQKYATGYLAAVMASDGDIDESEVKMWQLICTLADFPTMSVGDALEFWQKN
ncbi:MAG: tellurite resistance protein TerB [Bacteroidales bacterium]|nr:tellurite resistance protein TerB [Bacteroidales bacterium]